MLGEGNAPHALELRVHPAVELDVAFADGDTNARTSESRIGFLDDFASLDQSVNTFPRAYEQVCSLSVGNTSTQRCREAKHWHQLMSTGLFELRCEVFNSTLDTN